jgi:DNA-binding beta-propeller fold protein YncE
VYRIEAAHGRLLGTISAPDALHRPVAAAYDPAAAEVYVVDSATHDIKVFAAQAGTVRRVIGARGTEPGEFNFPVDIAYDGGLLWVVDAGNGRVQVLTRDGKPVSCIGRLGDAPGDLALPKSIAFDSEGHVYVVDARFENVQIFDRAGQLLLAFGGEGTAAGEFALPGGLCIDGDDRIWVCDTYNGRVQVFGYLKAGEAHDTP